MYVRLLAHFENHMAELHDIFVHVACGCGSVLLWQRCRKLCTSGFVDYVMFLCIGLYDASRVFLSAESVRGEITASIWGRLCSTIQIRNCTSMIAHRGAVCHLRLPYWCTLPVAVARSSSDSVAYFRFRWWHHEFTQLARWCVMSCAVQRCEYTGWPRGHHKSVCCKGCCIYIYIRLDIA